MYLHGTEDARGFRQWQQFGRYVKKDSKAFYIIGHVTKKIAAERTLESGDIVREEKGPGGNSGVQRCGDSSSHGL